MLIFNELPTAFPWYDKKEKQQMYRENARQSCPYKLISPNNALLPFQIQLPVDIVQQAEKWEIMTAGGQSIDISNNLPLLGGYMLTDGLYLVYKGGVLEFVTNAGSEQLLLPPGMYYGRITFPSGAQYFSEKFTVPMDSFGVGEKNRFVQFDYWNNCDIAPIVYRDGFKQTIYLDTFVHASEPEITVDGTNDGQDTQVPTFQKLAVRYRLEDVVPDFVKIALVSMQMHDNIFLTTANEVRAGEIENITSTTQIEDNGAFSTVTLVLEQRVLVKESCCGNMATFQDALAMAMYDPAKNINATISDTPNVPITIGGVSILNIIPISEGQMVFVTGWDSAGANEVGFYGEGNVEEPNTLPVIQSGNVTKTGNAFWQSAPAGTRNFAVAIKRTSEGDAAIENLEIWIGRPGVPVLASVQKGSVSVTLKGFAPDGIWLDVYRATTLNGTYTKIASNRVVSEFTGNGLRVDGFTSGYFYVAGGNYSGSAGQSNKLVAS